MTQRDIEYYAARLRVELAAAAAASDLRARAAHEQLASMYADLVAAAEEPVAAAAGSAGAATS
jgi:hypothetical protein